jgi:hypothetical protein
MRLTLAALVTTAAAVVLEWPPNDDVPVSKAGFDSGQE